MNATGHLGPARTTKHDTKAPDMTSKRLKAGDACLKRV